MPQPPDVPTVAETPGFEYVAWKGYAAEGDFPPEAVARLVAALQVIARDAEAIKPFAGLGLGTAQQEAIASMREDMPGYARIVDMAGVRLK
jgi:tripartite-type tricarboxylate transporter receptor subunit TctC